MDAKEDIKNRLSIEDVIGGYIELKRSGRNLKALSPFTHEKTASFMVSPEKQIWHDFSSGKGGDMFSFVMEMEGVDFVGSLELLARKAGIDMSKYARGSGQTVKLKQRMREALSLAAKYYHASLAKNKTAWSYLNKTRGFNKQIIGEFELGYAPKQGSALLEFLKRRGFSEQEQKRAGLIVSRRGGLGDMFRGRIMIPLKDTQGQVIGFTARLLVEDANAPKYINTPQTLLYDKSRHVYGLSLAKAAIRTENSVTIVEGNMDVIASHQAGVRGVVAIAGTALTSGHLSQLSRLSTNIKLAFDQDEAGIRATERSVVLSQVQNDINLSIVTIPDAKDPDELIRKNPKLWQQAIDNSVYAMDWLVEHYAESFDISKAGGKRRYSDKLVELIAGLSDPVEVDHYLQQVAERIGVPEESIREKLQRYRRNKSKPRRRQPTVNKADSSGETLNKLNFYDDFLGLLLCYPDTREAQSRLKAKDFDLAYRQSIFKYISKLEDKPLPKHLPKGLLGAQNYVRIIQFRAEEIYGDRSASERLVEVISLARRIAKENLKKTKQKLTVAIQDAEDEGDQKKAAKLLRDYQKLLKEA